MQVCKASVLASVWLLVTAASASHAADMPGAWFPEEKKQFFTDLVSGWYVRGDLGYNMPTIGSVEVPAPNTVTGWSLQNAVTLGFGGGYKHDWFRADITIDYANRGRFQGDTPGVQAYYTAKVDSFTILANAYLDLGTWGGFTPYVGAGVGTTNLRIHDYQNITVVEPFEGVQNTTRWNFAYAAMAGVGFRFSPNLVLDVGYRYLNMGDAMSGTEPPAYTDRTYLRNIRAHEVRIGLRWALD